MLGCKLLGFRQFPDLEPLRFSQIHSLLNLENGLART